MSRGDQRPRTTLLVVALFLTTTAAQAVFAQTDGHSSMEVDFGVLGTDGSCDDSSDEYRLQEATILPTCLLIGYQTISNARLNLSVWSVADPGVDLQSVELIVTPNDPETVRVVPTYLLLHDDMGYGVSQLSVRLSDWSPLQGDAEEPTINSDSHTLVVERPDSDLTGTFTPQQDGQTIQIAQSASLEGVLVHSNSGTSSVLVLPVLLLGDEVLAVSGSYSLRPGVTESRQVSFHLPSDIDLGSHTFTLALEDAREADSSPLWQRDIEVTVLEPFGSVAVAHANWDVTSFDANTALGTYPGDVVQIQLNLTNPGSLPASSALWVNFESETDCWSTPLGDILLEAGETRTSTYPVPVPEVEHGTTLDASLMQSSDCSADEQHVLGMEQIHVDDWPVSVSARVLVRDPPVDLDDTSTIPVSFNVTNLEDRRASGLEATLTLSVLGQPLGYWIGPLSLEANQTRTFQGQVPTSFCFDGDVDASIEIRDSHGDMIHASLTQDSIRTQFIEGEFDLTSTLVSDETVSLGMPIMIQTQIHAEASNPGGCTLLMPLYTIFESSDENVPPTTDISLVNITSGQSVEHRSEIGISASSGTYQASQHLMQSFSNDTTDDWLESVVRFAAVQVTPSDPDFNLACNQADIIERNELAVKIRCDIESHMPAMAWLRIGSEIDGSLAWGVPIAIDPYDKSVFEFSRSYRVGIDSTASVLAQVLWDGEWVDAIGGPLQFPLNTEHPLDGHEPLTYDNATTTPAYPKGGDPFAIQFWAEGSNNWLDGSYQMTLWLDESKDGPYYSTPLLPHGLEIGEPRLIEVGFESWPHTCGKLPYEIVAKDSEGGELDRIEGRFDGCTIELPDLSLVGQINLDPRLTSCVAILTVENTGSRHYTPDPADQADVTLIIDGMVTISSVTVPPLEIGETTTLEVGIPTSGFQDLRIILDGQRRHSELDRSNNGLGWSSTTGPIEFENDTDFDGLPNLVEESGYLIHILDSRIQVERLQRFLDDPANHTAPSMTQRMVYPSPDHHDSDDDGLSDYLEWVIGTNATNSDTDGDQYSDVEEYHSASQEPAIIELESPVIEAFEPTQTLQPEESELKSGLFTSTHTREFTVEDRNLHPLVIVRVVRPDTEDASYEPVLVRTEGDIRYYTVTYEYPWGKEFSVNVTAIDSFGNGGEFQIASKKSVWDRVTNRINMFAADALLGDLSPPILGFMTGLVYGLKDIVDFATGVVRFILDLKNQLPPLMKVLLDCLVPYFDSCPIDVWDLSRELWKGFVGLSPYAPDSVASTTFLVFAALGFLLVVFLSNSLAVKIIGKARSASSSIDNIASGIGGSAEAVGTTLSRVAGSGLTKVRPGVQGSILSKFPAVADTPKLSHVRHTVGDALLSVKVVAVRKAPVGDIGDAYKLIKKSRAKSPATYQKLVNDPHGFEIIKFKRTIIDDFPDSNWDNVLDAWIKDDMKILKHLKSGDPKKLGFARERLHKALSGESSIVIIVDSKKIQIDAIWSKRHPDGSRSLGGRELKHSNGNQLEELRSDNYKKAVPLSRTTRDLGWQERLCPPGTSYAQCYEKFIDAGVDSLTADDFAGCLTKRYTCSDFKTTPDINDLDDVLKGVGCMDRPGKCKDIADGNWGKEIQKSFRECADRAATYGSVCLGMPSREALDAACPGANLGCLKENFPVQAEDLRNRYRNEWIDYVDSATDTVGPVMGPLLDNVNGISNTQAELVFPMRQGAGESFWEAAFVLFLSISYLLTFKHWHPKRPEQSA